MKGFAIVTLSIVAGWLLGSIAAVFVQMAVDIPAHIVIDFTSVRGDAGWTLYRNLTLVWNLCWMILIGWAIYRVLSRRFLPRKEAVPGASVRERFISGVRHPNVPGLIISWVVAVCTVIAYPLAIYMSWRYFVEWRDKGTKACPRCAETVKAAAMVCRHCGQEFEHGAVATLPSSNPA